MNIDIGAWFLKLVGAVLVIAGVVACITTNFNTFDWSFAAHIVGGLLLIVIGAVLVRGKDVNIT